MASAVIGSLRVNLGIDTAEFQNGLKNAQTNLSKVGKSMQSVGKNMSAYLTAPITALGALTIKTAGDFEASMNRVDAATGATAEQFKSMRDMAVQLGAETSFSASESADAMEMLAKNGLSASQILDGAVSASMKLAAASGSDLSSAADVATDVMANFGKEAKDLAPLVDGITGVLLESKFGFDDYRLAIGQAGGVAGNLGVSFEDFNAVIAATSASFASGSDAGTSYKNFLTRLVPASDTAAAAMQELGLQFFNADGSMKSMSEVAEELQTKMSGLSDEALNQNMKDIFGVDAMRTAIMLMQQGSDGLEQFKSRIGDASAEEQAAARLKGFNGEMEKLAGAFETLQIAIADSGLLTLVTDLVSKIAGWVDALGELNPSILKWGTVVAGLGAALGPVVLTLGLMATAAAAISPPILAAIAAITATTAGITLLYQGIQAALPYLQQFAGEVWAQLKAGVESATQAFISFKDRVVQIASDIVNAFMALPAKMMEIGGQIIDGLWNGIKSKWESVKAGVSGIADSITGSIKSTLGIHSPSRVMHQVGEFIMQGLNNGMQSVDVKSGVVGTANEIESSFKSIGSSIGAAIAGTKSWKDVLKDVLGMVTQSIFSGFGGGGGGGGIGGFFSSLLGGLFGFANGGQFKVGGAGGVDSQLVAFKASPNETVSITKPGQSFDNGGGQMQVHVVPSPYFDVRVEQISDSRVANAAPAIVGRANQNVVPTMARYQNDKAGAEWR